MGDGFADHYSKPIFFRMVLSLALDREFSTSHFSKKILWEGLPKSRWGHFIDA
jgi:hypothetical protein